MLSLKIIFVLSALAIGLVFFSNALKLFGRREWPAAGLYGYAGAISITIGSCFGLLLIGGI